VVKKSIDLGVFPLWEKPTLYCWGGLWMFTLGNSIRLVGEHLCVLPFLKTLETYFLIIYFKKELIINQNL